MNRYLLALTPVIVASFLFAGSMHAEIYKTVDADGNVVFTDVPPKDQSKAIVLETQNTYTPEASAAPKQSPERPAEEEPAPVLYDHIAIVAPQHDAPVRENTGNVTVVVTSNPALDSSRGHTMQILVDGQIASSGQSNSVALTNLDRGTHQLTAQIVDGNGQIVVSSSPITFHMLRYSALKPRQNPG
jgi:hypothetical protein